MFQSLVIALREGVEACLIVGIVLSYLKKTGREIWARVVYWALFSAILASIGAAFLIRHTALPEDAYEGWLMLAGALFISTMVVWMRRTGRRLKGEIERKLSTFSGPPTAAATFGLFLFVFLMVLREGIETVLSLAAVLLRTTELLSFVGTLTGLGLAIGLTVGLFKGSLKVNLGKFFAVTSLVLVVVAAQLLVTGLHELSEARFLPASRREMSLIGPIVNNEAFFFLAVVGLALFLVLSRRQWAADNRLGERADLGAAERRKALAELRRDRFWKTFASAVAALAIVLIGAQFIYSLTAQAISPAERLLLTDGEAYIPVARLQDTKLHRYVVSAGGVDVRLIALLDSTDTLRVGLDACQICGSQGYSQDGKNVICRNCGAAIYAQTIGMAGGCNPVHVDYLVEGETVKVSEAALKESAKLFR